MNNMFGKRLTRWWVVKSIGYPADDQLFTDKEGAEIEIQTRRSRGYQVFMREMVEIIE